MYLVLITTQGERDSVTNSGKQFFCPNRTKSAVVPSVVEKCLSSTRAGTKAKALDLILLYVEVDTPDPVIVSTAIKGSYRV